MTTERDPHTQSRNVRLRRLHLGNFSWVMSILMVFYGWTLGLVDLTLIQLGAVALIVLLVQTAITWAIGSGWSERFVDPSLTFVQILFAVMVSLFIISRADEARTILLMLFIIAAFFGVFQLRKEQYIFISLVSVAGFAMIIIGEMLSPEQAAQRALLLLELGVFAVVMFWIAFIGSYVANLRRKLSQRNRELQDASNHLRHLSEHDELTGLPNRRRLLTFLENARDAAESLEIAFCVAVVDLDHFKRVNDQYGHQAGDEVLTQFGVRANHVLRGGDQLVRVDESLPNIGRFGGEEFLAILPGTDLEGSMLAAERLRADIEAHSFQTEAGTVHCTVSIGLACYQDGEPVHHTVGRADQALYQAKKNGRNRVETGQVRPAA